MPLAAALLLATLIGPERPVTAPTYGPAYGTQYPYELVSDGTNFLSVWSGDQGVYASVIDEAGVSRPLSPRAMFAGTHVQAAWTGNDYVLAWLDGQQAMVTRLNRDGERIGQPAAIAQGAVPAAIASLGNATLVVLMRDQKTEGVLVGPGGNVVRGGIAFPGTGYAYANTAAAAGGGFVVVTVEMTTPPFGTTVRATRVSASGDVEQSTKLIEGLEQYANSIDAASDGDRIGVAFVARGNSSGGVQRLHAFTVDARTLAVTAHAPLPVTGDDPQVVPAPGGFAATMLAHVDTPPLQLETIAFASGERHSTDVGVTPGANLHAATNGRTVLSVWRDYRFSPPYAYSVTHAVGLALDATATIPKTDVRPVAYSAIAQARPAIAPAGSTSLLVWFDLTKTVRGNLLAARVDLSGNVLDSQPFALASDVEGWQQPVAVFTGEVWMVAWKAAVNAAGEEHAFVRRISRYGKMLDEKPVDLGVGTVTAAASNGTVTLVIAASKVFRFSRAGVRLGETALDPVRVWGSLASNGSEFLFAWTEGSDWWQFPSANLRDVRAMRFDASGAAVDVTPIDVAISGANESGAFLASDGKDFLVAYESDVAVRAKRVLRSGNLADHTATEAGNLVEEGPLDPYFAVAVSDGGGYIASLARRVGPRTEHELVTLDAHGAAVGERVPLAVSERWLASAWVAGNVVAYSRTEPSLGNIERVYVRAIAPEGGRRRTLRR